MAIPRKALRVALVLLAAALALPSSAAQEEGPDERAAKVAVIRAHAFTGGHGWLLYVSSDGIAWLDAGFGNGTLLGRFFVDVDPILRALVEQDYADLPNEIEPQEIPPDCPRLSIEATVAGKSHRVEVTHPRSIGDTAEFKRFLAVWNALFEGLPLKPSW